MNILLLIVNNIINNIILFMLNWFKVFYVNKVAYKYVINIS